MLRGKDGLGVLRILVGLMFLIIGIIKILDPSGMIGAFEGNGFGGAAVIVAWIWILVEAIGGLVLTIGWKTKYAAWPLAVLLAIATIFVVIPGSLINAGQIGPGQVSGLFFHLITIVLLVKIAIVGPGSWAVDKM